MAQRRSQKQNTLFQAAYLQGVTGGWLLVIPALFLLFLLFHLHSSASCLRLLFFSGHPESLSMALPSFRVLRVLHCPTHPETLNICSIKPKTKNMQTEKYAKLVKTELSCSSHSLSRPAVQFGRCSQVFPLPGSPSAPSGQTPPLILLLLPLTDMCIKELECVSGAEMWEHCFCRCVIIAVA